MPCRKFINKSRNKSLFIDVICNVKILCQEAAAKTFLSNKMSCEIRPAITTNVWPPGAVGLSKHQLSQPTKGILKILT
jgi:hypothetical protein